MFFFLYSYLFCFIISFFTIEYDIDLINISMDINHFNKNLRNKKRLLLDSIRFIDDKNLNYILYKNNYVDNDNKNKII